MYSMKICMQGNLATVVKFGRAICQKLEFVVKLMNADNTSSQW